MSTPTSPWASTGPARRLGDVLRPGAPARERVGEHPADAWERLVAAGLTDVLADAAAGGRGGSLADAAADVADVAAGDLVGALLLAGHHAAVATLRLGGPGAVDAQRRIVDHGIRLSPVHPAVDPLVVAGADAGVRLRGVGAEVHGAGAALGFVVAAHGGSAGPRLAVVPAGRPGVVVEELPLRTGLRRLPAGRAQFLDAALEVGDVVAPASRAPDPAAFARAVRALFEAAAAAGAARGSAEAVAQLTRVRPRPRPVPGATSAIADPIGQAVIGGALGPIDAAHAFVLAVAAEFDDAVAADAAVDDEALSVRALAALDTALAVALRQGEEVFELAGTSGSGNVHGFDALWRDVRTLAFAWPRAQRRRAIGRAYLAAR